MSLLKQPLKTALFVPIFQMRTLKPRSMQSAQTRKEQSRIKTKVRHPFQLAVSWSLGGATFPIE